MDLGYNFFEIENKNIAPEKGKILISEPFLRDSYFKRSIVLLTEHNKDGSVGFVLNKPIDMSVNEVFEGFPKMDAGVSIGGPVGTNTVHYIHVLGDLIPNSVNVIDDIYWGGDFDFVKGLIKSGKLNKKDIRFFLGYSGWHPNQLENELAENSWVVADIDASKIMRLVSPDLWKDTLSQLGEKYRMWANFPENPGFN